MLREITGARSTLRIPSRLTSPALAAKVELPPAQKLELLREVSERRRMEMCRRSSRKRCSPRSAFGTPRGGRRRTAGSTWVSRSARVRWRDGSDDDTAKLDAHRLRADFAVFDELVNGKPVAFLDSAASAQKPRQVLDAMRDFYEHSYANVHRGVYRLAERATTGYETGRAKVAGFVNSPSEREVIFTRSATEALNLVAYAWGLDNLGPSDVVVVTDLEHHSSFVPWQYVAGRTGAAFKAIPIDEHGELQLDALEEIEREGTVKVVASILVSNTLGTVNPVRDLAAWAHERGAIMVVDAAQARATQVARRAGARL